MTDFFLRYSKIITKFIFASFAVGFVMSWFNLTPESLIELIGATPVDLIQTIWNGIMWTLPHITLGAIVIAPIWLLAYLVRPPQV